MQRTDGSPRLADVARHAGVSTATVSRALSAPNKVSAQIKARVQTAVQELAYVPHGAARALASRRSRTVGIVVPTLGVGLFSVGVEILQRRLEEASYTLLLANSQYDPHVELKEVQTLVEQGVAGIALVGHSHLPQLYELLQAKQVPYVNTYTYAKNSPHPCIGIDNRAAAYRLTKVMVDLGHRDFGVIASPTRNNDRAAERVAGVRDCLDEHRIELPPSRVFEVQNRISDGRSALTSMLAATPSISAVLCTSDTLAIGVLFEARKLGIAVPGKVSVSGFDDFDISSHLDPPLTTVRVPAEDLGNRIASYLLDRIESKVTPQSTELPANLIMRESIGPASR